MSSPCHTGAAAALDHMQDLEARLVQVRARGAAATDPAERLECEQVALRLSEALSVAASYHGTVLPRLRRLFPLEVGGWWAVGRTAHHFAQGISECGRFHAAEVATVSPGGLPFCALCEARLAAWALRPGGRHG